MHNLRFTIAALVILALTTIIARAAVPPMGLPACGASTSYMRLASDVAFIPAARIVRTAITKSNDTAMDSVLLLDTDYNFARGQKIATGWTHIANSTMFLMGEVYYTRSDDGKHEIVWLHTAYNAIQSGFMRQSHVDKSAPGLFAICR